MRHPEPGCKPRHADECLVSIALPKSSDDRQLFHHETNSRKRYHRVGLLGGVVHVSSERRIFPRRYQANASQPYTLIGLTIEETSEFERLDHLSLIHDSGDGAWNFDEEPMTPEEKRWHELYRKHETGWSVWRAAEGGSAAAVPVPRRAQRSDAT
jgi:hypothetical protein